MTMDQKVKVLIFLIYALDNRFPKKSTLTILLASLVFSSPHFLFLFVLTLDPSKHGCNERKEEEPCFAFRIIHVFVYRMFVKHVMDIQALFLQGEWEKFAPKQPTPYQNSC
jgi:hypothetical protein